MNEYENLKLDDVFVFHASTGYVVATVEDEFSVEEITGAKTQSELDEMIDSGEMEKCLLECYDDFMANNVDSGWYRK